MSPGISHIIFTIALPCRCLLPLWLEGKTVGEGPRTCDILISRV